MFGGVYFQYDTQGTSSRAEQTAAAEVPMKSEWNGVIYLEFLIHLLVSPLSAFFLIVGIANLHECRSAPKLPFWMIVSGAALVLNQIASLLILRRRFVFRKQYPRPENKDDVEAMRVWEERKVLEKPAFLVIFQTSMRLSLVGLSLVGFVWSAFAVSHESTMECDQLVVWPSFVLTALVLLSALFWFCNFVCVTFCMMLDVLEETK